MSTKYQGTKTERLALDAYIAMMRASTTATSNIHRYLKDLHITVVQFGVLEALHHLGPLSPLVLAEKLLVTPGNVTVVVNNLVKRKLVSRRRQQKDRRCVKVSLTTQGKKLIQRIFPDHVEKVIGEMADVSEVCVYGIPSEQGAPGESDLVAAVAPFNGASLDPAAIYSKCKKDLEPNFIPSYIQLVDEVPKTISEKFMSRILKDEFSKTGDNVYELADFKTPSDELVQRLQAIIDEAFGRKKE